MSEPNSRLSLGSVSFQGEVGVQGGTAVVDRVKPGSTDSKLYERFHRLVQDVACGPVGMWACPVGSVSEAGHCTHWGVGTSRVGSRRVTAERAGVRAIIDGEGGGGHARTRCGPEMGDVGRRQAVGSAWNAARRSLAASPGFSIPASPQTANCCSTQVVNHVALLRRRRQTLAKPQMRSGLNQLRETGISSHAHPPGHTQKPGPRFPTKPAKSKSKSWVQAVQAATFHHAKISGACPSDQGRLSQGTGQAWRELGKLRGAF